MTEKITTTQHGSIASALAAAQAEMGPALKSAENPHFRSKYADLASVMDACLPALNRHGIAVIQPLAENEFGRHVVTRFIHSSGETLECPIPLIVGKNDMQGLGSAITYARRYGLMSLAGIAPEDDDGNAAAASMRPAPPVEKVNEAAVIPQKEIDAALAAINRTIGLDDLKAVWAGLRVPVRALADVQAAKDARKTFLDDVPPPITEDEIPY
jgi:hypothetical protein